MTTSELLREAVQTIERLESFLNDGADIIDTSILQGNLRREADRLESVEQAEAIKRGGLKMGESIPSMWEDRGKPKCRQCLHPEEKGVCTCDGNPFTKPKPERLEELPPDISHWQNQDLNTYSPDRLALNTLIRDYNERKGL